MRAFLQKHLDDAAILAGCVLIILATWMLSLVAALYVTGLLLIGLGILAGIGNGRKK